MTTPPTDPGDGAGTPGEPGSENPYAVPGQGAPGAPDPAGPAYPAYGAPGPAAPPPGGGYPGGYPVYPNAAPVYPSGYGQPTQKNSLGVWSLVLGIASFVLPCGLVTAIIAIVIGVQGRRAVRAGLANNAGVALAGVILGWVALAVMIVAGVIIGIAYSHDPDAFSSASR